MKVISICVIGCLLLSFVLPVVLAEQEKGAEVTVILNGLVCDFCARAIEKTLAKQPEIADMNIDLTDKELTIIMNPGQNLSDKELTELVQNAGYGVDEVVRGE